jgi:hypothetical protein
MKKSVIKENKTFEYFGFDKHQIFKKRRIHQIVQTEEAV